MPESAALFVDDDPEMRELYRGFGRLLEKHYEVTIAGSGQEGLRLLGGRKYDVIVTDLTMPEMDGLTFLGHAAAAQPDCARIIISGHADRMKIGRCLFIGHRYFDKPCDLTGLAELLIRLTSFRKMICDPKIRRIIGGVGALPGPPETYLKVERILEGGNASVQDIAAEIEQDVAVSAKLIQIVNSAQFGVSQKVVSLAEAIQFVGLESVRSVMLGIQAFAGYKDMSGKRGPSGAVWEHSVRTALLARRIARTQKLPQQTINRAFLAGLMHDVGRVIINANAPEELADVETFAKRFGLSAAEGERRYFGATQSHIGAYLLTLWGIDEETVRAVQHHETLSDFQGSDPQAVAALHVAHFVEMDNSQTHPLDVESLAAMGIGNAEEWIEGAAIKID